MKHHARTTTLTFAAAITLAAGWALGGANPGGRSPAFALTPLDEVSFQDGRTRFADGSMTLTREGKAGADLDSPVPTAVCFAEGHVPTPEENLIIQRALQGGYNTRYNAVDRWSGTAGDPISLTWSFAPDGTLVGSTTSPGGEGPSELFSRMDSLFAAAGGRATWVAQFTSVFNRWSQLTGVNYTRVTLAGVDWDDGAAWGNGGSAGLRGDVRIGMKTIDGVNGILAYNSFPAGGAGGDMVLDRAESWNSSTNTYRFLRNTASHEHGHGLGYAHTCPQNSTKLMEPGLNTNFDGPQQDDIRGGQDSYGDPDESNDTPATATDLGSFVGGQTLTRGTIPVPTVSSAAALGLHDGGLGTTNDDTDYFKITLDAPHLVTFTATPFGSSYLDLDQNANGSCQTTGTPINAIAMADLALNVYNATGTNLLRSDNTSAIGLAETLSGVLCDEGISYARVLGGATWTGTQLYTFNVNVAATSLACNATDLTFSDKVVVTWPAVPDATGYQISRATTNNRALASNVGTVGVVTTFDDTSASPGVQYYYWTKAQQTGNALYRFMQGVDNGEPGMRAVPNVPPTANAGSDQTLTDVNGNGTEPVTLNGSLSSDSDGTITNYEWKEGATVLASSASPTANVVLGVGLHTITLTVRDDDLATGTDTVVVTINPANQAPTANAGPDQTLVDNDNSGSEPVTLNGSGSSDTDGVITTYEWKEGATVLASGPSSVANIALSVGVHTITLTVTDDDLATATDTMVVTIEAPPACDPDVNQDGNVDQGDIDYLIDVVGGGPNPTGIDPDINADGNVDQGDVDALINIVAGGPCP